MLSCALRRENSWKHLHKSVYFVFWVFVFVVVLFLIQFVFSEIFKMISHNLGMFVFVILHIFISIFSVICIIDIGGKNPRRPDVSLNELSQGEHSCNHHSGQEIELFQPFENVKGSNG